MHFFWVILNPSIHQYSSLSLGPLLSLAFSSSRRNSRLFHITSFYFLCTTLFLVWSYMEHKEFISVCVLCDFLKPLKHNISSGIGKYISAAPLMFFFSTNQSVAFPKCHHFISSWEEASLPQPWPLALPYNHFIYMGHEKEVQRAASA